MHSSTSRLEGAKRSSNLGDFLDPFYENRVSGSRQIVQLTSDGHAGQTLQHFP